MTEHIYGGVELYNIPEFMLEKREEIVRCRDCAFYAPDPDPIDPGWPMWCERHEIDMVRPDGFCAWGERKDV